MMTQQLVARAIVESRSKLEQRYPWPHRLGDLGAIALDATLDELAVGTVMAVICDYNGFEPGAPLRALVDDEQLVVGGGVELRRGDEILITPGCCCGLETWREWNRFAEGGAAPWGGHTPILIGEQLPDGRLSIGARHDGPDADIEPILETTADELRAALRDTEADLAGFLGVLQGWASRIAPEVATAVVTVVRDAFQA